MVQCVSRSHCLRVVVSAQVPYIDNQGVLDLIEQKPVGILPMLDEVMLAAAMLDSRLLGLLLLLMMMMMSMTMLILS